VLFKALREATDLPIHFHTHDTSGIAAATVLAAVDAGVDAVDAAMDALLRQYLAAMPGSIVEALRGSERDPGLDPEWIRRISFYWEAVRTSMRPSKAISRDRPRRSICTKCRAASSPTSRNRRVRWGSRPAGIEVAQAYADANQMFGDIVKVTPSSKVVGDMALMMVSQDLTVADVEDPDQGHCLPRFRRLDAAGRSRPAAGGLAEGSAAEEGVEGREGLYGASGLAASGCRSRCRAQGDRDQAWRKVDDFEFASYLMYPKVFTDYAQAAGYATVRSEVLPTPAYFYGLKPKAMSSSPISRRARRLSSSTRHMCGDRREGHGHGVLRAQRPAAPIKVPDRAKGASGVKCAPQGREAGNAASRRADAGRHLHGLPSHRARSPSRQATCCFRSRP
jgi:pyruvate carboxylase